eukprot:383688_1
MRIKRVECKKNKLINKLKLPAAYYQCIFNVKNIVILGRNIDIETLLTEQLNTFIRTNLEIIISRYELGPIESCIEIAHLIRTLKLTCDMLSKYLNGLDSFDSIFSEINEDTTLGSFRSRLYLTTYNKLFNNLLPNYIFNQLTQRYVSLNKPKRNRKIDSLYLWGTRFTFIFEQRFRILNGYFGIQHLEAIIELMGINNMPLLIDETVKSVAHIIIRDISSYVEDIFKNLDPMRLQNAYYGVLGVYGYYDLMLEHIKEYRPSREGAFTLLRGAGNTLCLIQLLDLILMKQSFYNNQILSFYNSKHEQPFIRILQETLQNINKNQITFKSLFRSCIKISIQRQKYLNNNSGRWLFSATLQYLHQNLIATGVYKKWQGPTPNNGILEHENPKDFSRFWSVSAFVFLVPDYTPKEEEIKRRTEGYISDRAYFGDGWLWCGTTILYLTNLFHRYKVLDPTLYLDKLQILYPADLDYRTNRRNRYGSSTIMAYKPFVKGLLNNWQEIEFDQE